MFITKGPNGVERRNADYFEVELEETPSSTHHLGHGMGTPQESTGRKILPGDAPFIAYETPGTSPQRPSTLKHKSSSRSNVEGEYPASGTSHTETPIYSIPTDPDVIAAAKAREIARAAKSEKMKAITKGIPP